MGLFEHYVEAMMLKNQELHEEARRARDERRILSIVVARTMRHLQHASMVTLEVDQDVMDLVDEKLSGTREEMAQLPIQALYPALPESPLLLDFGHGRITFQDAYARCPSIAGMAFLCPGDREIMRQAQSRLPAKYHPMIASVLGHDQHTWTLSCLDDLGEDVIVYHYREEEPTLRSWQLSAGHQCPFKQCRYLQGMLKEPCHRCEDIKALMTMTLGLLLLYNSGYYREVIVSEEEDHRTALSNSSVRSVNESETTRPVKVRRIRKNVLVKELAAPKPVLHPRGSWLEKHPPDQVATVWKKREPFDRRTRSGTLIRVTPTKEKRIRMLLQNVPEHLIIELYAQANEHQQEKSEEEKRDEHTGKIE